MRSKILPFVVEYKNGEKKTIDAENQDELITKLFGSESNFKKKAHKISWKVGSTICVMYAEDGRIERQIADGDVNPYGWRMKHS
ncbi:MAG: hypothetical protein RIC95_02600 [Vicingaceae bacterium]